MKEPIIENAIITGKSIYTAGFLSMHIELNFNGYYQGFGGYAVYAEDNGINDKNYAGHFIYRVMQVAGVSNWEEIIGKAVRARHDDQRVYAIGHIIKDIWFETSELEGLEYD